MILRVGTLLACISLLSFGCKQSKDNSHSASKQSNEQSVDDLRALENKLNSLTPVESKLIDDSRLSDVFLQLENIVALNAAKGTHPMWGELQKKLQNSKSEFSKIAEKYPTVGALRQASGFKDYKDIEKNPAAVAAWRKNVDAFPADVVFPDSVAGESCRRMSLSVVDRIAENLFNRVFFCSLTPLFGSVGLYFAVVNKVNTKESDPFIDSLADGFIQLGKSVVRACLTGKGLSD